MINTINKKKKIKRILTLIYNFIEVIIEVL